MWHEMRDISCTNYTVQAKASMRVHNNPAVFFYEITYNTLSSENFLSLQFDKPELVGGLFPFNSLTILREHISVISNIGAEAQHICEKYLKT